MRARSLPTPGRSVAAALLAAAAAIALPRLAAAQACCVGTGLVTPARLRLYEDRAVGVGVRARSILGTFGDGGTYTASASNDDEVDFEQDLFGAVRFGPRFQAALQIPIVETSRSLGDVSGWGGGIGDVAASARYDVVISGERGRWPGVALVAALVAPTGRPVEDATDALATSATGTGSFDGSIGLAVEEVIDRAFVSATVSVGQRTGRTVGGMHQSFAPRLTALLTGGYAFSHDVTLGGFALGFRQGDARDDRGEIAGSSLALVTAGVAAAAPLGDEWRLQGTLSGDVPIPGWGRNQAVGIGLSASVLRSWM